MIDIHELRLGNLVLYQEKGWIGFLLQIAEDDLILQPLTGPCRNEEINGYDGDFSPVPLLSSFLAQPYYASLCDLAKEKPQFLHQLQNLHFAVYNRELPLHIIVAHLVAHSLENET